MDVATALTILVIILSLGGAVGFLWLAFLLGKRRGYAEGSSEVVPMSGTCGGCGWEAEPGTIQDVMAQIVEHDCPNPREP